MLTGLVLAVVCAPSALAETGQASAPRTASAAFLSGTGGRVEWAADPVPSPSPSASVPQITLGTGVPGDGDGDGSSPAPTSSTGTDTGSGSNPAWYDIPGQVEKALTGWFTSLATDALNPLLNVLGSSLLGTPDVTSMARVQQLWEQMAVLANALYILLIVIGGAIVMGHQTVQSLYSAKEIAPRLVAGLVVGNASMAILALLIHLSDALATAILGQGVNPNQAGAALAKMIVGSVTSGGIFTALLACGGAAMLVAVLLTWIVRLAAMVILAAGAPLALACHALPHTEHVARMWWRAVTACLVTQLGQSLCLVVALQVLLDPGSETSLGIPTGGGFIDILTFLALLWLLVKIPMWTGRRLLDATGGSRVIGMAKTAVAFQTMGAAKAAFGSIGALGGRPKSAPAQPGQDAASTASYRVTAMNTSGRSAPAPRRVVASSVVRAQLTSSKKGPFMSDGRRRPAFQQTAIPIPGGVSAARAEAAAARATAAPAPPAPPSTAAPEPPEGGPAPRVPRYRQEALFPRPTPPTPTAAASAAGPRMAAPPTGAARPPAPATPQRPTAAGAGPAAAGPAPRMRAAPGRPPAAPPVPPTAVPPARPVPTASPVRAAVPPAAPQRPVAGSAEAAAPSPRRAPAARPPIPARPPTLPPPPPGPTSSGAGANEPSERPAPGGPRRRSTE